MANKISFSVEPRTVSGKAVKTLRRKNIIPASISVPREDSVAIQFPQNSFVKLYDQVGESGLLYVSITGDKTPHPVLIEEVQMDGLTNQVTHVMFRQVNLKEKIKAEIPLELVGENSVPGAVVISVHSTIEVEALPADLPEKFEVDIEKLTEIGQMVKFSDLNFDRSQVTLMVSEDEMDSPVVMLQEVKEEVAQESSEGEVPANEGAASDNAAEAAANQEAA